MKRLISTFGSLVVVLVAASFAGCGSTTNNNGGGATDMAMPVVKMDMPPAGMPDLTMLKQTGADCMAATECQGALTGANKKATCQKSSTFAGRPIMWTGGFCTSACSDTANDKMNGQNPACPSDNPATCFNGLCALLCADSMTDCKDGYICANVTQTGAICLPLGASTCDPLADPRPGMKKCAMGQTCVDYSPDKTYGECATTCDPIAQMCPPPMQGMGGCVLDYDLMNGMGTCIGVSPGAEGSPCVFLNGCAAGMQCSGQKCRQYCRTGGGPDGGVPDGGTGPVGCPMGQTCKDIPMSGVKANVVGICSP